MTEMRETIRHHLADVLNAKRGFAPAQPAYGLTELSHHDCGADRVMALQCEIQDRIRLFEPRLSNVQVERMEPDELAAQFRFRISARLTALTGLDQSVKFETSIDATSGAEVD